MPPSSSNGNPVENKMHIHTQSQAQCVHPAYAHMVTYMHAHLYTCMYTHYHTFPQNIEQPTSLI